MQLATYELKYCERCGSLRLRRSASAETYCEPCGRMLANYSLPNHAERASLLLRKSTGKIRRGPRDGSTDGPVALPFGRLQ